MKELMCTHLTKRGSTYYYRRKTPTDLIHLFGKEKMESLGTKDRQEASKLVRAKGVYYDALFEEARAKLNNSVSSTPTQVAKRIVPKWEQGLTVHDAHVYAARLTNSLRAGREKSFARGEKWMFDAALNNMLEDAKQYLRTGIHPFDEDGGELWKAEAQIKVVKAFKKGKDLPYIEVGFRQGVGKKYQNRNNRQPIKLENLYQEQELAAFASMNVS